MSAADAWAIGWGFIQGFATSSLFILALFIGFCVVVGFTKLKRTSGHVPVVRSLEERMTGHPTAYLGPTAPRGPADQLQAPELIEAAARK